MPESIARDQVEALIRQGAQVLEVLPRPEYEWAHIAGAVHVPLADLDQAAGQLLERGRPIVAYCNGFE